jgi:hypothetical protein
MESTIGHYVKQTKRFCAGEVAWSAIELAWFERHSSDMRASCDDDVSSQNTVEEK